VTQLISSDDAPESQPMRLGSYLDSQHSWLYRATPTLAKLIWVVDNLHLQLSEAVAYCSHLGLCKTATAPRPPLLQSCKCGARIWLTS
jgi:hypothetical protein